MAGRTNDAAGDGTTTAAVLARDMVHFGLQAVTAGYPQSLNQFLLTLNAHFEQPQALFPLVKCKVCVSFKSQGSVSVQA